MKYTITKVRQVEDIIFTEVDYDFNGLIVHVSVPHFQPKTKGDVISGIVNRMVSEQNKLNASNNCTIIASQIALNETVIL